MKEKSGWLYRGLAIWLLIICVESVNWTIRNLLIAPRTGELNARQISFFTAALMILLITYIFLPWIQAKTFSSLIILGTLWAILTALFKLF